MMTAQDMYQHYLTNWSDIQNHVPRLYEHAKGVVLELGVRFGVSTAALLAGVEDHGGEVWSVDINDCSNVFANHPQWHFVQADSLDIAALFAAGLPPNVDVLFIDTVHTYEHTMQELHIYGAIMEPGGVILLHDTEDGMTYPGVENAIKDYCAEYDLQYELISGSYGLGIIRIP